MQERQPRRQAKGAALSEPMACAGGGVARRVLMPAFGKARPRVTTNGTYMPAEYEAQRAQLRAAFGSVPDGLVHLSVSVVRQMPASWSRAERARQRGAYARPKPDIDNILGAVMDALFQDDDRVVSVFGEKKWGDRHELLIEVVPA